MTPEQLALTVDVPKKYRSKLDHATKGLDQFPKLTKLLASIPVQKLIAGGPDETGLDIATGGQYAVKKMAVSDVADLPPINSWETVIRINLESKKFIGFIDMVGDIYKEERAAGRLKALEKYKLDSLFAESNQQGLPLGKVSNFTMSLPFDQVDTALLVHEFGHHVMNNVLINQPKVAKFFQEVAGSAHDAGRSVSTYADSEPSEWWAETFTAYVFKPDELKELDHMSYELMKAVGV